ncbi:MAG TPA: type IV pilus modification protein PilV [Gammaproteobacteria bacterium]
MTISRKPRAGNSRGFTLIEVLIAVVVLSVGMLGVAALLINSLQSSGSAILRTRAVTFAEDMADRIRANSAAGASYVVDLAGMGANNNCTDTANTVAANCTSAALAMHDIFLWKTLLAAPQTGLPNGQASITRAAAGTISQYTITVQWSEQDGNDYDYVLTFQAI